MKYKGLIFDFDYTLGDSTEGIVQCVNYALGQLGYQAAEREEIRKTIGLHLEETFRVLTAQKESASEGMVNRGKGAETLSGKAGSQEEESLSGEAGSQEEERLPQEAEFSRLFREKADRIMTDSTSFFPGALECLKEWKEAGYRLAIVTTKYHYRIEAILEKYQASDLIDVIVGGEDVKLPKPDPEGIFQVLSQWQASKEEALYVGDSLVDARTAQAAGVDFAGVTTGTTSREELAEYPNTGIWDGVVNICLEV